MGKIIKNMYDAYIKHRPRPPFFKIRTTFTKNYHFFKGNPVFKRAAELVNIFLFESHS